jgi:hypothetical protein
MILSLSSKLRHASVKVRIDGGLSAKVWKFPSILDAPSDYNYDEKTEAQSKEDYKLDELYYTS